MRHYKVSNGSVGAGELLCVRKRKELSRTITAALQSESMEGDPEEVVAQVRGASLGSYVVPVGWISGFDQHPGYRDQ